MNTYIDVMDLYEVCVKTDYSKFRTLKDDVIGPRYNPSVIVYYE